MVLVPAMLSSPPVQLNPLPPEVISGDELTANEFCVPSVMLPGAVVHPAFAHHVVPSNSISNNPRCICCLKILMIYLLPLFSLCRRGMSAGRPAQCCDGQGSG